MPEYRTVKVVAGNGGWGGPLYVTPTAERPYICSCTGMVIHKVAKEIARLTGGELRDAFRKPPPYEQMACVVTDCGGTARCEMYPGNGVPTIAVFPLSPSGAKNSKMTPDMVVTGVNKEKFVTLVEQ